MNKNLLSTFGNLEDLFKDAIRKDIEGIEYFFKKRLCSVYTPDDYDRPWVLGRSEKRHLRALLSNLKTIEKSEANLIWHNKKTTFFVFKIHKGKYYTDLYREIIRSFAKESIKLLVENGIRVECNVESDPGILIVECV